MYFFLVNGFVVLLVPPLELEGFNSPPSELMGYLEPPSELSGWIFHRWDLLPCCGCLVSGGCTEDLKFYDRFLLADIAGS